MRVMVNCAVKSIVILKIRGANFAALIGLRVWQWRYLSSAGSTLQLCPAMRSTTEALVILRLAFRPLRCDARLADQGREIVFRIFDVDNSLIRERRYPLTHMRTDDELRTAIQNARNHIAATKDTPLEAWSLPRPF